MAKTAAALDPAALRSRRWFDNPDNPEMTALYLERYLNFGLTRGELQAGKPIIGIAQSGSDLAPCNRHHLQLAARIREGIREAGGIAFEFPVHPIQETGKRPTASRCRRLALERRGRFKVPEHQTPWQEIQRGMVDELSRGMVLKPAVKYQRIAKTKGVPRDNH
jgi:dihydroxyacid dehydratase/phosphogluconate dehydratase